ncbi:MAG: arsenate reductase (glutaredoxin) [Alphaproteobacteria bacterium CG_4_10_14_0_2_um_filter_63_37]|nr:MAG: arsenate reductase (glutaredoxin) [Proteobacteria bacterium CG1_02_64_396]PJA23579.1 MAG: arsenate reductase (glutaredoxin) [Alphaproteobacteria bacterium CG_4_10_14_0_2_um_filter_63_37]
MSTVIYHNPRCSKSRQTLQLLHDKGIEPEVILYLDDTPTHPQLDTLLTQLGLEPMQLMRKGEEDFKTLGLKEKGASLSRAELIDLMIAHPKLIERPIVVKDGRARLGRPPEAVLEIV